VRGAVVWSSECGVWGRGLRAWLESERAARCRPIPRAGLEAAFTGSQGWPPLHGDGNLCRFVAHLTLGRLNGGTPYLEGSGADKFYKHAGPTDLGSAKFGMR
jgi:hypothetical protein